MKAAAFNGWGVRVDVSPPAEAGLSRHGVDGDVLLAVVDEDGVDEVGGGQDGLLARAV